MCSILSSVLTSPHRDKKASLSKSKRYCSDTFVGEDKSPPQIIFANYFDIKNSWSVIYPPCLIESAPTKNIPSPCFPNTFISFFNVGLL